MSYDLADSGSMVAVLNTWLTGYIRDNLDVMMPAKVVSYDEATNRVTLQPLVKIVDIYGDAYLRAEVHNIPVYRFGGGGYFIRFPIKSGDLGWLKSNDRDISAVLDNLEAEGPGSLRMHSMSDGVFFPDTLSDWNVSGDHDDALVIQSNDGETVIALDGDTILVKAKNVNVEATDVKVEADSVKLGSGSAKAITLWPDLEDFLDKVLDALGTGTTPVGTGGGGGPVTFVNMPSSVPNAGATKVTGV